MNTLDHELEEGGKLMSVFFRHVFGLIRVGMTSLEIDEYVGKLFKAYDCLSAPIYAYNFPGYTCISINDCMCHGIPNNYKFQHGDVISVDISYIYKKNYFDAGRTFIVIDPNSKITYKIKSMIELNGFNIAANLSSISALSQMYLSYSAIGKKVDYAELGKIYHSIISGSKYSISYEYGGHKLGEVLHMPPFISSVNDQDTGYYFTIGDRFCFEPLLAYKCGNSDAIVARKSGWEVFHKLGESVVHYENTYIVLEDGIFSITSL